PERHITRKPTPPSITTTRSPVPETNGYKPPTPPPTVSDSRSQTSETLQVRENGTANGATTPTSKMVPAISSLIHTNSDDTSSKNGDSTSRSGSKSPGSAQHGVSVRDIAVDKIGTSVDNSALRRLDRSFQKS
ncbi:hypothetical protein LTS18_009016, partial [Coniosporium uncinatum]